MQSLPDDALWFRGLMEAAEPYLMRDGYLGMPVGRCKELWREQTGADGRAGDKLACDLCQGYTLDMEPNADSASARKESSLGSAGHAGPSLLGSTYLAAQVCPAQICSNQSRQRDYLKDRCKAAFLPACFNSLKAIYFCSSCSWLMSAWTHTGKCCTTCTDPCKSAGCVYILTADLVSSPACGLDKAKVRNFDV